MKWKSDWGLSLCFNCVAGVLRIRLSIVRSSVGDKLWCPLITDASHMRTVDISLWAASLAGWWRSGYMNLLWNRSSAPCVNMDSLCNICKGAPAWKKHKTCWSSQSTWCSGCQSDLRRQSDSKTQCPWNVLESDAERTKQFSGGVGSYIGSPKIDR